MRAGIRQVIIPKLNEKDLPDIPPEVTQTVKFLPAETVDDVLGAALEKRREGDEDAPGHEPEPTADGQRVEVA